MCCCYYKSSERNEWVIDNKREGSVAEKKGIFKDFYTSLKGKKKRNEGRAMKFKN